MAGEIFLSDIQVVGGYIGEHMKFVNNRVFLADQFLPGFRMYKTGDVGAWTEEMDLRYIRRVDSMVKVRGYRVELEEVEDFIRTSSPMTHQACAIVEKENIYAFVTPETVDTDAIRKAIQTLLPSYAIPSSTVALAQLPTTPNQKADRKALLGMIKQTKKPEKKIKIRQSGPLNKYGRIRLA